jgi:predicted ATPase
MYRRLVVCKIEFIIETHSEYILRRSQVIVAENEFEVAPNDNPFSVYYFNDDLTHKPYRLEYEPNGRFNKNFGNGFFDEATKSTMAILKPKTQN